MNPRLHPFSLRQLQYAVAVAQTLSFRTAAARCRVSQPSLSTQIAQLEEALGTPLFERDRRRVLLTAAGRAIIERASTLLVQADDLVDAAARAGDPQAGTLRIGVLSTISAYLLPALTPRLRRSFARLSIGWIEGEAEALQQGLATGALDGAILALGPELSGLELAVIAEDPLVLAAAPGHALVRRSTAVSPRELRGHDVLLLERGHCLREQALAVCAAARAREQALRATSLSSLVQMVAGGAGFTLLPALVVPMEAKRAKLRIRTFSKPAPQRTLALAWRQSSPRAPVLSQLIPVIRESYHSVVS